MLHVVTPSTVSNRSALKIRKVPRSFIGFGLGMLPRGAMTRSIYWRMAMEINFLRYCAALVPFPLAMLIFPEKALLIGQAPALMFLAVYFFESRLLSVDTPERRRRLMAEEEAERGADMLGARGREVLTQIAAQRGLGAGVLHLVVEQSALARLPPITLVSLQRAEPQPEVLDLSAQEQAAIRAGLFDGTFTEKHMHTCSLALGRFLHDVSLDARGVSAHARLAALAAS
ncbi:hypothetical protein EV663_11839 [Rhodovulum bhavnagarense]|uniref:Uncharacterized protein n=1 Tax=Rhodovulum bhavnagarense TaxID=992286 RepID=A0A4R2R9Q7_9RHOB|nr:hypothetical protein [Rhodovulum bhavnagarense]TCP58709.1 hypothetical protein EV663_11839 [Rhodovulum bhavnagarense]